MSKPKSRKKINNYILHLDEPLGAGAYATVYKAHDDHSGTLFAAKVIDRAKSKHQDIKWKPTSIQQNLLSYKFLFITLLYIQTLSE